MNELTAYQAAVLADDVYALTKLDSLERAKTYMKTEHNDVFEFPEDELLKGKTGGPGFIKVRTAFGFALLGKGVLEGQAIILFRGTQYLADWLTNLNVTVSRTRSGKPVHDGFNQAFRSMESQLKNFMTIVMKSKVHTIHCIGHSLGGALATICGDWIHSEYKRKSFVYTFGSPRVGLYEFSDGCTRNLGAQRIFRAYHATDIVPCIPVWPYLHTPNSGTDYFLPSPGIIPLAEYHGMNHYIDSVEDRSWTLLASLRDAQASESRVMQWLKEESPIGLTISTIEWLNRALMYVLEKCLNGAAWMISKTFTTTATLMDRLALILSKGIDLGDQLSSWVVHLIRKIMTALGLGKAVEAGDLTRNFIRSILVHLQSRITAFTQSVLSKVMVKGRVV